MVDLEAIRQRALAVGAAKALTIDAKGASHMGENFAKANPEPTAVIRQRSKLKSKVVTRGSSTTKPKKKNKKK